MSLVNVLGEVLHRWRVALGVSLDEAFGVDAVAAIKPAPLADALLLRVRARLSGMRHGDGKVFVLPDEVVVFGAGAGLIPLLRPRAFGADPFQGVVGFPQFLVEVAILPLKTLRPLLRLIDTLIDRAVVGAVCRLVGIFRPECLHDLGQRGLAVLQRKRSDGPEIVIGADRQRAIWEQLILARLQDFAVEVRSRQTVARNPVGRLEINVHA